MAFKTSPSEDYNFQKNGVTTGGCSTSNVNGSQRTEEELLNHASSHAAPNSNMVKAAVKDQLIKLRDRYHNPSWHQHFLGIERAGLQQTIKEIEAEG